MTRTFFFFLNNFNYVIGAEERERERTALSQYLIEIRDDVKDISFLRFSLLAFFVLKKSFSRHNIAAFIFFAAANIDFSYKTSFDIFLLRK